MNLKLRGRGVCIKEVCCLYCSYFYILSDSCFGGSNFILEDWIVLRVVPRVIYLATSLPMCACRLCVLLRRGGVEHPRTTAQVVSLQDAYLLAWAAFSAAQINVPNPN